MSDIGKRAYVELTNNWESSAFEVVIGQSRWVLNHWKNGDTDPSAFALKNMCEHGMDIEYILTGRK